MTEPLLERYAVVGNPIGHSKSPRIHSQFAQQTGQLLSYETLLAPLDSFAEAMQFFFAQGGKGLNVTLPFKEQAFALCHRLSEGARRAGAVNTLWQQEGELWGDNTDGVGLVRDLSHNLGWQLDNQRILLLGAGGAVRGVLMPLLASQPATLVIANRTASKAQALAADFDDMGPVVGCGFADLEGHCFDIVINGTSASLQGELPPLPAGILAQGARVYDMMYGAEPTVFMRWAQAQGAAQAQDGLGMLVEQAAQSFFIWRGVRPQTAKVISSIRESLLT
ncbi:shikimate dehydrogenase [Balneatrix alpica]|uniref:Shikimate dehydrogenase (NADP(+)) n=1 Tax=Balneatrix alpica TaxID=75684 RepID=A0ABV5ZA32_9GAMM|nr:shikimate dehydrogenase [Balneatrix alpica]